MAYLDQFTIPFLGLSLGEHEYEFQITNAFFEQEGFMDSEIKSADVKVKVLLNRQETLLILNFDIEATIGVDCDRCLTNYSLPVNSQQKLIVKFDNEPYNDTDDILVLSPSTTILNLAQTLYEYLGLLLPYQRIPCEDKEDTSLCDKEVLNKLEQYSLKSTEQNDSRWEALKKIKTKE